MLPDGIMLRPATLDDGQGVYDLIVAHDMHDYGESNLELSRLLLGWGTLNFDLSRDARVAVTPDGRIVGYGDTLRETEGRVFADGYVHPEYTNCGLGTALLDWQEAHAAELTAGDHQLLVWAATSSRNLLSRELLTGRGYQPIRHFWRMEINLTDQPPETAAPAAGIELRSFRPEVDTYAVYEAVEEAFSAHWGWVKDPFEEWQRLHLSEQADSSLWQIAWDGDTIAGAALNAVRGGVPWVHILGVRDAWRGRGIGMTLLTASFHTFWERGYRLVGLGVDTSNETGATRLYERAGMQVARQEDVYEKVIR